MKRNSNVSSGNFIQMQWGFMVIEYLNLMNWWTLGVPWKTSWDLSVKEQWLSMFSSFKCKFGAERSTCTALPGFTDQRDVLYHICNVCDCMWMICLCVVFYPCISTIEVYNRRGSILLMIIHAYCWFFLTPPPSPPLHPGLLTPVGK